MLREKKDLHESCSLASKTTKELADRCAESVDRNDMYEAYHCALHHMRVTHTELTKENIEFFLDRIPYLKDPMVSIGHRLGDIAEKRVEEVIGDTSSSAVSLDTRMAALAFRKYSLMSSADSTIIGFLTGLSMHTFVTTRGEGCIFSMVDPTLCKEEH